MEFSEKKKGMTGPKDSFGPVLVLSYGFPENSDSKRTGLSNTVFFKRIGKMSCFQGIKVSKASSDSAESQVIPPGIMRIFLNFLLEFHCPYCCQCVIDIIHRIEEDVQFLIP